VRIPGAGTLLVTGAIVLAAAVSLGGGATFVALEITTQPEFCKSCHIMEPYYQSWQDSSHGNVSCVECHYEPGLLETFEGKFKALSQLAKYATQTQGSKPWAEVSDYSCMRSGCHNTRLLEGEIKFGEVRFDHREHLIGERRGMKLRCTSCHSQIVQGDHLAVTPTTCFLCHFKEGEASAPINDCLTCHPAPTAPIAVGDAQFTHADYLQRGVQCASCHGDIVRGAGEVPAQRCGSCHNQQEHLERYADVAFLHQNHVTDHSITCLDCHTQIQHGLPPQDQHYQGDCKGCHEGSHGATADVFRGTGGRGVPDRPAVMYEARVTCNGCHRPPFAGAGLAGGPAPLGVLASGFGADAGGGHGGVAGVTMPGAAPDMSLAGSTFEADPLACIDCHGPGFELMTERWQAEVAASISEVQAVVRTLHEKLAAHVAAPSAAQTPAASLAAQPTGSEAAARHYQDAAYNLSLVLLDRSKGVHNLPYVRDLLARAAGDARDGVLALDPAAKVAPIDIGPRVSSQANCATLCHVGVEEVRVDKALGLAFAHETHLLKGRLDCTQCHRVEEPGTPAHGSLALKSQDCATCHHANEDVATCASCHAEVVALRSSVPENGDAVPMADLDCTSCHLSHDGATTLENVAPSCNLCHDGEGIEIGAWLKDAEAPLMQLDEALVDAPPELAATVRAELAALRRAGPFHNTIVAKARVQRLAELLAPPAPAVPAPAPTVPAAQPTPPVAPTPAPTPDAGPPHGGETPPAEGPR